MTPEEHYDEAELLAAALADTAYLSGGRPIKTDDSMMVTDAAWNAVARRAELHVKLAEVGLLFQRATRATNALAEQLQHEAGMHDFPLSAPRSTAFCQRCGRCWEHRGAECVGRQENSTAKACLLCIGGSGA